jgi:hypothetical protein
MPSIIEVDTIKNKTGTQNTVLSTDGSGNNTLNANTIKDGSATKTLATLSSSAVTLHSDVTFPTGHFIKTPVTAILDTNASRSNDAGTMDVLSASITVDSTSDRILAVFIATIQMWGANTLTQPKGILKFVDSTGSGATLYESYQVQSQPNNNSSNVFGPLCSSHIVTPSATGTNTFKIQIGQTGSTGRILIYGNNDSEFHNPTQILLYYIKG